MRRERSSTSCTSILPERRTPRRPGRRRPGGQAIEIFLDRGNPAHWIAVATLAVSGALTAWIGLRDGLVRRRMVTNAATLEGRRAVVAGLVYVAFGLAGLIGGAIFVWMGH